MASDTDNTYSPADFQDIRPYNESEFHDKLVALTKEEGFKHAIEYIMPNVDYDEFCKNILDVKSQKDFQQRIMGDFLKQLEAATTSGITATGFENVAPGRSYTFISNHRDIVLDASFLNLCLIRHNLPITQVAIGNNLLIYEWITDLVKLNRSFIVKRDVKRLEALEAAKQLSAYIHYTITTEHESIWIAQRQGRAKDSNDLTQESLIKMLSLAGDGDTKHNLIELNILPVSISYEYDPNDYLKAREFLLKRRDPDFQKSQRDDLFSMETGLLSHKGRVHFHIGECINQGLDECLCDTRALAVKEATQLIDKRIHRGYYFLPINYMAYDLLYGTHRFEDRYTTGDVEKFEKYISGQLAKVDEPQITDEERAYMREMILTMYSNPVKNHLAAFD